MASPFDECPETLCPAIAAGGDVTFRVWVLRLLQSISTSGIPVAPTAFSTFLTQTSVPVTGASTTMVAAEVGRIGGYVRANPANAGNVSVAFAQPAVVGIGDLQPGMTYALPAGYDGPITGIRPVGAGSYDLEVVTW